MAHDDFYCFYSIDIVNSTGLKLLHGPDKWAEAIKALDYELKDKAIPFWKYLGDEWIFVKKIKTMCEFIDSYYNFLDIVETTYKYDQSIIGRVWIIEDDKDNVLFPVKGEPILSEEDISNSLSLIEENKETMNKDWVSTYLDLGFRFGKNCNKYDIALSVEVSFLLSSILKYKRNHDYYFKFKEKFESKKEFMYAKESDLKGLSIPYVNIILADKKLHRDYKKESFDYKLTTYDEIYDYTSKFIKESFGIKRFKIYNKLTDKYGKPQ